MIISLRSLLHFCILLTIFLVTFSITGCRYGTAPTMGSESRNNLQVVRKEPQVLRRYDSFFISDIGVYSIEGDALYRVQDREVEDLAEGFRAKLIRSLGSQHAVIPQRTRNTGVIKVALTDVSTSYGALQILPGAVVPNAMRGGASIVATVHDSVTNEMLVKVTDSRQGSRQGYFSGLGKWDGTERAFEEWAQILAQAVRK